MKEKRVIGFLSIIFAVIMLSLCIMANDAQSAIPETINYQGYLTDNSGNPINATVSMTFRIYTVASGGTALWTETQSNIPVNEGIYNVILGSVASLGALPFDVPYFLGVTVGIDSEMTPRQALTSVAYALTADTALNVPSNVINSTMIQDGTISSADVNFNFAASTSKDGPATGLSCTGCVTQTLLGDSAVNSAKIQNGTILFGDIGGNGCTANQIMKYTGSVWGCAADVDTDTNTTYTAGTGLDLVGSEFRVETPLALSGSASTSGGILVGTNTGINGLSSGVRGISSGFTGFTSGVHGISESNAGVGVAGLASSIEGRTMGVLGQSDSTDGIGVLGITGASGTTFAVLGSTLSPDGYGGVFENSSETGVALKASGTGIIQSTAKSYLWISGNGVRKYRESDSTIIDMTNFGGAVIQRGATVGNKNVMFPITIMGPLYGQDVRITGVDIYWKGETEFDAITAVLMRRQTGVCTTSECYTNIKFDTADHGCEQAIYPTGCTLHYDITTGNVLSADSGILYLTIEFAFSSSTSNIWIGGVRLTLEHD